MLDTMTALFSWSILRSIAEFLLRTLDSCADWAIFVLRFRQNTTFFKLTRFVFHVETDLFGYGPEEANHRDVW
jgi:hypothetical protein